MLTTADITKLKRTFATKKDLKKYATKEDLSWQVSHLRDEMYEIGEDIKKELKGEFITRFDAVMGELKSMREEHAAMFYRQRENTDKIENHEDRISKIEVNFSI